uniref:Uncharacterized protein n=1 Tax=Chenopodium quinoa TaxID=63459 RepID=A0A803MAR8_CHEQI
MEEELNKLRNLEFSSSNSLAPNKLGLAISGLAELYKSIGDLLKLPQTQNALAKHDDSSWVDELLEESVSFLDVCEHTRENLFLLRESIGKLQSSFRRRNNGGEVDIDDDVTKYVSFVKNLKRDMGKSLVFLKQIDIKLSESLLFNKVNNDQHIVAVVRVLRESSLMCSIIFKLILGYFSGTALQPKASKWSLVLKVVHNKGHVGDDLNDLEDAEIALNSLIVRKLSKQVSTDVNLLTINDVFPFIDSKSSNIVPASIVPTNVEVDADFEEYIIPKNIIPHQDVTIQGSEEVVVGEEENIGMDEKNAPRHVGEGVEVGALGKQGMGVVVIHDTTAQPAGTALSTGQSQAAQ